MQRKYQKLIDVWGVALILISTASIHAQAMSVRADRPDWFKTTSGNPAWNIVLEGPIELGDLTKVERALSESGVDGADIYITSPGGNLLEAMRIGRAIRKARASTWLGTLRLDSDSRYGGPPGMTRVAGGCYSACALAFLGGVYRFGEKESKFGVHRFSSTAESALIDLDLGQIVSASIVSYISEMGVDPTLLSLMMEKGRDGIRLLTSDELLSLAVTNEGRQRPTWDVELIKGTQYLRGSQKTYHGEGKIAFLCVKEQIFYYSFYEAGPERAKGISEGNWHHSLLVDGETIQLPDSIRPVSIGSFVSAMFPLTKHQALLISNAGHVGHAMQMARAAPTFVGYRIEIPRQYSNRVQLFLRNCVG